MNTPEPAIFTADYWNVLQLDHAQPPEIQSRLDTKTRLIGALSQLERIAGIKILPDICAMVAKYWVFVEDIKCWGVTSTTQQVLMAK